MSFSCLVIKNQKPRVFIVITVWSHNKIDATFKAIILDVSLSWGKTSSLCVALYCASEVDFADSSGRVAALWAQCDKFAADN